MVMWPKRKILILRPPGAGEGEGFQALLDALQIETILREVGTEEPLDLTGLTMGGESGVTLAPDCGPTEIVYWPEFDPNKGYRQWGVRQGLPQCSVVDFLHKLWEQEIILPVAEDAQEEERPLLWTLLAEAGFEPSLLWCRSDQKWLAEQGRGIHWVVPEAWLNSFVQDKPMGREAKCWFPKANWVIGKKFVDFYWETEPFRYCGKLERCPLAETEEHMYRSILQALQLGVSWGDVKKNVRWYGQGDKRNGGAERAECSLEDAEHLANRRIG